MSTIATFFRLLTGAQFAPKWGAQFAPKSTAHFKPKYYAQFVRNLQFTKNHHLKRTIIAQNFYISITKIDM